MPRWLKWLKFDFLDNLCQKLTWVFYKKGEQLLVWTLFDIFILEPLYFVNMSPSFVSSAFLHFKKHKNVLQTWSLCLLDKNLPHFVYPQLKSCCSKHLDSWTLCISRIFRYRLLWQETVALWNKSNFHSVKRTTLNPHSFISIEFTQHKSTMILLQVKYFVQPFFCLCLGSFSLAYVRKCCQTLTTLY